MGYLNPAEYKAWVFIPDEKLPGADVAYDKTTIDLSLFKVSTGGRGHGLQPKLRPTPPDTRRARHILHSAATQVLNAQYGTNRTTRTTQSTSRPHSLLISPLPPPPVAGDDHAV